MGGDSGHEETRVGPHDLDARNTEVGDGGCNCRALDGGHGSNGSVVLDAGVGVALQTDGGGGALIGLGMCGIRRGTEGGVLAHANGSAPRGSDRVVLCADQSIDDFGTDDLGGADAVAKCGGGVCDLLEDDGLRKPPTIFVGSYACGLGEGYNAYAPGASPSQLAPFGLSPLTPIGLHPSTLLGLADLGLCASRVGHGRLRGLGPLQQRRRRCPASDRWRWRPGHDRR
jgi:hypothetical protein